jgi:uncharacterized membrane protein (DUF485 family)
MDGREAMAQVNALEANKDSVTTNGAHPAGAARALLLAAARDLVFERLSFAAPFVLICLISFMSLTALTGFSSILTGLWVGPISLLSVLLLAHIPAIGLLTLVYERRARAWDRKSAELLRSLAGRA